ncbi:hypothetical protein GEMRC1_004680 [Eukaryota sp. GEM-RC1]
MPEALPPPDPNYEPDESELLEYAEYLGMDPVADADLLWIAREGINAPLPEGWTAYKHDDDSIYYFNHLTQESFWEHPLDSHYKQKYLQEKEKKKKQPKQTNRIAQPLRIGSAGKSSLLPLKTPLKTISALTPLPSTTFPSKTPLSTTPLIRTPRSDVSSEEVDELEVTRRGLVEEIDNLKAELHELETVKNERVEKIKKDEEGLEVMTENLKKLGDELAQEKAKLEQQEKELAIRSNEYLEKFKKFERQKSNLEVDQTELEKLKSQLKSEKEQFVKEKISLKQSHGQELIILKDDFSKEKESLMISFQDELKKLKQEHLKNLEEFKKECEEDLVVLENEFDQQKNKAKSEHLNTLEILKNTHEQELIDIKYEQEQIVQKKRSEIVVDLDSDNQRFPELESQELQKIQKLRQEYEDLEQQKRDVVEQVRDLTKELDQMRAEKNALNIKNSKYLAQLEDQKSQLEDDVTSLEVQKAKLLNEMNDLTRKTPDQGKNSFEKLEEVESGVLEVGHLEDEIKSLQNLKRELLQETSSLETGLFDLKNQLSDLEGQKSEMEQEIRRIQLKKSSDSAPRSPEVRREVKRSQIHVTDEEYGTVKKLETMVQDLKYELEEVRNQVLLQKREPKKTSFEPPQTAHAAAPKVENPEILNFLTQEKSKLDRAKEYLQEQRSVLSLIRKDLMDKRERWGEKVELNNGRVSGHLSREKKALESETRKLNSKMKQFKEAEGLLLERENEFYSSMISTGIPSNLNFGTAKFGKVDFNPPKATVSNEKLSDHVFLTGLIKGAEERGRIRERLCNHGDWLKEFQEKLS